MESKNFECTVRPVWNGIGLLFWKLPLRAFEWALELRNTTSTLRETRPRKKETTGHFSMLKLQVNNYPVPGMKRHIWPFLSFRILGVFECLLAGRDTHSCFRKKQLWKWIISKFKITKLRVESMKWDVIPSPQNLNIGHFSKNCQLM